MIYVNVSNEYSLWSAASRKKCVSFSTALAMYSVTRSTNAPDLLNSSSSVAFQAASLFLLRSSDMYAYFASQLNSAYYILNQWQSHHCQIFLEDHSPVNRWQYVLGFCRLWMYRNCTYRWVRTKHGPGVHGPPPWTESMDHFHGPPSWTGCMDSFFKIMRNEQKQK